MYQVQYETNCGTKKSINVISETLALQYFAALIQAIDAHEVAVIDGLTGEVILLWIDGKFEIINRCCI